MTQWHPLFAQLLRPLLERYYEVETNMPVGDAPRQADIVLVRRKSAKKPPFHGMWKNLITWNVLEFKGPTVSARLDDLDELVELGLGIHRRLNEERYKQKQAPLRPDEISWWYLANHLGRRFLRDAPQRLGEIQPWSQGIWRCVLMQRPLYLVSRVELPVEEDSLPLHVLASASPEAEEAVIQTLTAQPRLWREYVQWIATLHPSLIEEIEAMARTSEKEPKFHLKPLIRLVGLKRLIEEAGVDQVITEVGPRAMIDKLGVKGFLSQLTPEERRELKKLLS